MLEVDKIEFKEVLIATEMPSVKGEALVFCYPTYKLYISPGAIEKSIPAPYKNETGERLLYNIRRNKEFEELMNSVKGD